MPVLGGSRPYSDAPENATHSSRSHIRRYCHHGYALFGRSIWVLKDFAQPIRTNRIGVHRRRFGPSSVTVRSQTTSLDPARHRKLATDTGSNATLLEAPADFEGIEVHYSPVMAIASECVRRGFEEYRIAANSLLGMPIAPGSGHNGVTSSKLRNIGVCGHGLT
jgi:hypothetical protein